MSDVTLLMAVHCHQPVGNFGSVFEQAYAQSYEPFLSVLERHPGVRLSLHYSGCLLDWLRTHRPEFLRRVRALAKTGRIELLGGGYFEPILPLLPERDRQGQLALMRAALRKDFGADMTGCWLTERVWEPDLPGTLAQAGIRYTMVDASQFAGAARWLPADQQVQADGFWDLLGCYATAHGGDAVTLFPASKRLRYWMPFKPVEQTIEFLRSLRRDRPVTITFADDGEKFGLWPKTYDWVYTTGWLDQFFAALERESSWLKTTTFRESLAQEPPSGTVALPCGSYEEMLEWSGGYFRNFFSKYPEARALQNYMLDISRQVASCELRVASSTRTKKHLRRSTHHAERLRRALYAGQCNCAYWHGVFGGLYLAHLRRGVTRELIEAERLVQRAAGRKAAVRVGDVDGDGYEEARLANAAMSLVVDPADQGGITQWNSFEARVNLLDTLSRRPEPYHEHLKKLAPAAATPSGGAAVASIHEAFGAKEADLDTRLVYDDHRRTFFLDYGVQELPSLEAVVRSLWGERRLWSPGPYRFAAAPTAARASVSLIRELEGRVLRKRITLGAGGRLECAFNTDHAAPVMALEFNVALRDARYLREPGVLARADSFEVREPSQGVAVRMELDRPATLMHFPVETVSESESGMERTYQALAVLCFWTAEPGQPFAARARWTLGTA